MTRRAPVDRRASPVGVLRDVRAHVHRPELVDEVLSIVSLVRAEGDGARPIGPRFDHREGRNPLGMTIRRLSRVSTISPERFSIRAWPMKQSFASMPAPLR